VGLPGNTSGKSALLKLQLLAHFLHELAAFVRSFLLQLTERDQGALGFRIFTQTRIDTTQLAVSLGQVGLIADSYLQFSGGGLELVRARPPCGGRASSALGRNRCARPQTVKGNGLLQPAASRQGWCLFFICSCIWSMLRPGGSAMSNRTSQGNNQRSAGYFL